MLELELLFLGYSYVDFRLTRRFGDPDLGLLWKVHKGIVCGGGDGCRYVRIGVALDEVISA